MAAAIATVPREPFDALVTALGAAGKTVRAPSPGVLKTMLNSLELQGTERVLYIGTAVGYPAALLSHLAEEVRAVEMEEALLEPQILTLAKLGRTNVQLMHSDGVRGWHDAAPFQTIVSAAAAPELPPALVEQLAVNGRIVIPLGDEHAQLIELLDKRVDALLSRTLGRCTLPVFPSLQRTPSSFPWTVHDGR